MHLPYLCWKRPTVWHNYVTQCHSTYIYSPSGVYVCVCVRVRTHACMHAFIWLMPYPYEWVPCPYECIEPIPNVATPFEARFGGLNPQIRLQTCNSQLRMILHYMPPFATCLMTIPWELRIQNIASVLQRDILFLSYLMKYKIRYWYVNCSYYQICVSWMVVSQMKSKVS